jgi:hypothetical protein
MYFVHLNLAWNRELGFGSEQGNPAFPGTQRLTRWFLAFLSQGIKPAGASICDHFHLLILRVYGPVAS